jgi:hypothetical protein
MKRKRPPTQVVQLPLVLDNEEEVLAQQRARSRKKGAKKRYEDAQLSAAICAEIDEYCRIHPHTKHTEVMEHLKKNPATKPLVAALKLKPASLAKKISRYRRRK